MYEKFYTQGSFGFWTQLFIITDDSIVYKEREYKYTQLASIRYFITSKYSSFVGIFDTNGEPILSFACGYSDNLMGGNSSKKRFKYAVSYANEQIAAIHGKTLICEEFEKREVFKNFVIMEDAIYVIKESLLSSYTTEIYPYTTLTPIIYHEKYMVSENTIGAAITKGIDSMTANVNILTLAYNFEDKKRFEAAMSYANEQIAMHGVQIGDYSIKGVKEYKMKCNVCGNVYCYTQKDLEKNAYHASQQKLAALAGLGFVLSGNYTASGMYASNSKNASDSLIDYTKCPRCNSTDIRAFTDEEWEMEKTVTSALQENTSVFSAADELKKFKELLDSGVITQEEFAIKKKQLLGLEY